jgi:hypothetical protein
VSHPSAGLIELFVVLVFVLGWGIWELATLRVERRKDASKNPPRHPEG